MCAQLHQREQLQPRRLLRPRLFDGTAHRCSARLATALGQIGQTADARQAFAASVKASLSYVAFKTGRRSLYVRPEDHEHLRHG